MSLSSERIVETAVGLLTEYGLHDVTMRRLASELSVRPGALYYHVPHKQELLRRVAHQLLAPLQKPDADPVELMLQFRDTVLPLRDGGDLLLIAYGLDQRIPPVPALEESLQAAGLGADAARRHSAVLMRFALGAVAAEQNISLLSGSQNADRTATSPGHPQSAQNAAGAASNAAGTALSAASAAESADLYAYGLRSLLAQAA